jgi:antitoxin component of MazEF toxin-antitoxin module
MLEKDSVIRKSGNSVCVIIPADIWKDSSNKLKIGQKIKVTLGESGREMKIAEKT